MGSSTEDDVKFFMNGEEVGSMQTVESEYKPEREFKDGDSLLAFNREYSVTMNDIQINEDFLGKINDDSRTFTVIGQGYAFPRGNKFPKKKRIRKKWKKKYCKEFKLDDCRIG
ncbi:hypothetical protein [Aquibacillus saliphilus]|uniref:hypothetical protein n=1 Tax=Aquibacillus saliphilus TaxID=1909422 RepID=UPI001CF00E66|nr:hypothetical protein [Aquibacillus saliphilus]